MYISKIRALKVISYSLIGSGKECAWKLIELDMLDDVLKLLSGKEEASLKKLHKSYDKRSVTEHSVSIIANLFRYFHEEVSVVGYLMAQFFKKQMKLLRRLIEWTEEYKAVDEQFQATNEDEEDSYIDRLDSGLFTLQLLSIIIMFLYHFADSEVSLRT